MVYTHKNWWWMGDGLWLLYHHYNLFWCVCSKEIGLWCSGNRNTQLFLWHFCSWKQRSTLYSEKPFLGEWSELGHYFGASIGPLPLKKGRTSMDIPSFSIKSTTGGQNTSGASDGNLGMNGNSPLWIARGYQSSSRAPKTLGPQHRATNPVVHLPDLEQPQSQTHTLWMSDDQIRFISHL